MPEAEILRYPIPRTGWRNWGGDRTWLAPQSDWKALAGRAWPPDMTWDNPETPHEAGIMPCERLRLTSQVSGTSGIRVVREHGFENGDFVVVQRAEKIAGAPVRCAPWAVTCVPIPREVVVIANPDSTYSEGYHIWPDARSVPLAFRRGNYLHFMSKTESGCKIGIDSPFSAIAARGTNETLVIRAPCHKGEFPDAVPGCNGFPIEFYTNGLSGDDATESPMVELEILSHLVMLKKGQSHTLTTRWSILEHPSDEEIHAELGKSNFPIQKTEDKVKIHHSNG